ncbi:MAG: LPS export ABC transporter periplasmic protein LptC [Elusimicrobiota bacterium]|jgi:LPS export ABC transporter protein LptC|nr:LPS export ABC transporter periplasmic protein LptC [Elusimicrobiota bacterium]
MEKIKLLCVIIPITFLLGCGGADKVIDETPPIGEHAIEKFTITETEGGKLKMIMESESATINENMSIAKINVPIVKFYKDGEYTSTLVMEKADIDLDTYDVKGYGRCVVDTAENERLQTTDLQYDAKTKTVFSKNPVRIERKGETIDGTSFRADTNLENIVIENQKIVIERTN